jgi:subtilisin family serine protease
MKFRLLAVAGFILSLLTLSRANSEGRQYIVALKSGESIAALNKARGTKTVGQVHDTSIYLVESIGEADDKILKDLKKDKAVETAENNGHVKLRSDNEAPLSPILVQQMAALLDGQTRTTFFGTDVLKAYVEQPALYVTRVNEVRTVSTGAATRVAFIDTGVDFDHPALRPWLEPGVDLLGGKGSELDGLSQQMATLIDQQGTSLLDHRFLFVLNQSMASLLDSDSGADAFPTEFGHGTLVAGVIHVVAPDARIVPIKAFDANGDTTMFTIISAIYRTRELNIDVLNMSFSTEEDSDALRKAIFALQSDGVSVVASAGNDASGSMNLFPASYPGVTGVAATDFDDRLASFSNYGKAVSVSAPGAFLVSTVPGGKYAAAWGTSFSAPMVAGANALVASVQGHGRSVSPIIINTADFIDSLNPGFEKKLGTGRINVKQALGREKSSRNGAQSIP